VLQTISANAKTALKAVNAISPACSTAVAEREIVFKPLSKLVTRTLNSLKATDTSPQEIDNVKTLIRKIQGIKATPKKTDEEKAAPRRCRQ